MAYSGGRGGGQDVCGHWAESQVVKTSLPLHNIRFIVNTEVIYYTDHFTLSMYCPSNRPTSESAGYKNSRQCRECSLLFCKCLEIQYTTVEGSFINEPDQRRHLVIALY